MALPLVLIFGLPIIGLFTFWGRILGFLKTHITPWIHSNFPSLAEKIDLALTRIDQVVVAVRHRVKEAWALLRQKLLKVLVSYAQRSSGWVRQTLSWCVRSLEGEEKIIKRTEVTEESYDDIPDDIRAAWIRGQGMREENITERRDQELSQMSVGG
jgi:hypothetical protein